MSAPEFLTQTLGTTYQRSMPNQTHASERHKTTCTNSVWIVGQASRPKPSGPCRAGVAMPSPPLQIKINKKQLQSRSAVKVDVKVTVKTAQSL